jgi:hypothetical protein
VGGLIKVSDKLSGLSHINHGKYALANLLGSHDAEYYQRHNPPQQDPAVLAQIAAESAANDRLASLRKRRRSSTLFAGGNRVLGAGSGSVLGAGSGGGTGGTSTGAVGGGGGSASAGDYANSWRTGLP